VTLQEIKDAVAKGQTVCWQVDGYRVRQAGSKLLVVCLSNGSAIGLAWADGLTMNGKPEDFYVLGTR
jgi:hypothetical protein